MASYSFLMALKRSSASLLASIASRFFSSSSCDRSHAWRSPHTGHRRCVALLLDAAAPLDAASLRALRCRPLSLECCPARSFMPNWRQSLGLALPAPLLTCRLASISLALASYSSTVFCAMPRHTCASAHFHHLSCLSFAMYASASALAPSSPATSPSAALTLCGEASRVETGVEWPL